MKEKPVPFRPYQLHDLSIDCISLIVDLVGASSIGSLWLCGDHRMKEKLVHGVTKFELDFQPWLPVVWPGLLSSLTRLQKLRTFSHGGHRSASLFSWSSIPSTLVSLELTLHLPKTSSPTEEGVPSLGLTCSFPHLRHFRFVFSQSLATFYEFPNFKELMPNLVSLEYRSKYQWLAPTLIVPNLPSGLVDLAGIFRGIEMKHSNVEEASSWPSSLNSLEILHTYQFLPVRHWTDLISILPPSLTRLWLRTQGCPLGFELSWAHLPNLKHLFFYGQSLSKQNIARLPRDLLSLELCGSPMGSDTLDAISAYPPNLTLMDWPFYATIDAELAAALPRSLTKINDDDIPLLEEALPLLPPHLDGGFEIDACFEGLKSNTRLSKLTLFGEGGMENLPPNLTSLVFKETLYDHHMPLLPVSLREITSYSQADEIPDFALWPRDLQTISMSETEPPDISDPEDDLNFSRLPRSIHLPPTLTALYLGMCDMVHGDWFMTLPPTLTALRFDMVRGIYQAETLSPLASSNLTTLSLPLQSKLFSGDFAQIIGFMPRKMTSLSLAYVIPESGLRNEDMAHLPRGLLTLALPPSKHLTQHCLQHLPRHLTLLSLGERSVLSEWSH